jgi:hypothetical protein
MLMAVSMDGRQRPSAILCIPLTWTLIELPSSLAVRLYFLNIRVRFSPKGVILLLLRLCFEGSSRCQTHQYCC